MYRVYSSTLPGRARQKYTCANVASPDAAADSWTVDDADAAADPLPHAFNTSSATRPSVASRSKKLPLLSFVNTAITIGPLGGGAYMMPTSLPSNGGQSPVLCPMPTRKRTRCGSRDVYTCCRKIRRISAVDFALASW